jgi:hypothetical protein
MKISLFSSQKEQFIFGRGFKLSQGHELKSFVYENRFQTPPERFPPERLDCLAGGTVF